MPFDLRSLPVDRRSEAALGARGLGYRLVSPDDLPAYDAWIQADNRGFHESRASESDLVRDRRYYADRRMHGVYDSTGAEPAVPVATISSWPTGLSMPGGRSVDAWAISSVTVAPTHRRRGIARAMMEAELRSAVEVGAAVAVLTVSEATLYGRYGFAPAARAARIAVDRRRARWHGPDAPGRTHLVDPRSLRDVASAVTRRAVARTPGEIDRWPALFDRILGVAEPESSEARRIRAFRYDDESGETQGFATYKIEHPSGEPATLHVEYLAAATDEAERALWRALVEVDLIGSIRGRLRSVDEALPWLIDDARAFTVEDVRDHLWVRVLDPIAALAKRRYSATGSLTIEVDDPLGFAAGVFEIEVTTGGRAEVRRVEPTEAAPTASRRSRRIGGALRLGVDQLGAILLGDVRPSTLARAGHISGNGVLELADGMFASSKAPQLAIWF